MTRWIHRGRKYGVHLIAVPVAGGGTAEQAILSHPGSVGILPVLSDGRLVLIENQRRVLGQALLEIPAGTLEPGEAPHEAALRELEEETGYVAAALEPWGRMALAPGCSDEWMHVFVARGLRPGPPRLEPDEAIEVRRVTVPDVRALLVGGRLEDSKTIAVLGRYLLGVVGA